MKRIAIFNDFQLPLPAVRGGSVPTLTNFILDENEIQEKYKIDVFSCYDENAFIESKKYKNIYITLCPKKQFKIFLNYCG